jgi:hypothetical protein
MRLHLRALDALALALVDHGHVWSADERALYDAAVTSCAGCRDVGLSA